jgi:predicted short-subunit dehydrogenase-like oxidoreductase (DUF2520 family)
MPAIPRFGSPRLPLNWREGRLASVAKVVNRGHQTKCRLGLWRIRSQHVAANMTRCRVVEPRDVKKFADVAQFVLGPVGEVLVQEVRADEPVVRRAVGNQALAGQGVSPLS